MIRVRLRSEPGLEGITIEAETAEELETALEVVARQLRARNSAPEVLRRPPTLRAPRTPRSHYEAEAAALLLEGGPMPLSAILDGLEQRFGRPVSTEGVAAALKRSGRIRCVSYGRAARWGLVADQTTEVAPRPAGRAEGGE